MRAILALLCLFSGTPDDLPAEGFTATGEPKVERYRALLTELASSAAVPGAKTPIDLPEGIKEAIDAWTADKG
jgi:hypothetical protein